MDYKEVSKNTAISFVAPIGDYNYKGAYKYDANGVITDLSGSIFKNDKFVGNFARNNDSEALNITGIVADEDLIMQATNSKSVIDYIVSLVKTAVTHAS